MEQTAVKPVDAASIATLHGLIREDLKRTDDTILKYVDNVQVPLIPTLARHLIASGGKRLRPSLTLACTKLFGYEGERHVRLAAAVEFIHTATLLHDDVVDESHLRRGSETANDVWGNKASVLVGDFLLSRAFQLMVADGNLRVLQILSDASAIIAQGEVLQLSIANNPEITEEQYFEIITTKTAALFAAACELGPVVADRPEHAEALRRFGLNLGIAFQIMDDALDYAADQSRLGKTVGDDFHEGKVTLPVLIAYRDGNEEEKTFWRRTLQDKMQHEGDLKHAIGLLAHHGAIERAIARAEEYCDEARRRLGPLSPSPIKNALLETVDFCIERAY
jgi:octaprenyl-diphosphate synthase